MRYKVVVATRSFGSTSQEPWELLKEGDCEPVLVNIASVTDQELMEVLRDADGFIVGKRNVTSKMIIGSAKLKIICMHGVGVDHIDLEAAKKHNVIVANCPGANSASVADLTLGLMLAVARQIPEANQALQRGKWGSFSGIEIWGKTLGLVGLGAVGRGVAKRAAGFNMTILVHDPFVPEKEVKIAGAKLVSLDHLFGKSDFISLHAPLTESTRNLIDRGALLQMKRNAILINTARGELVDEQALFEALQQNEIAGAGLDVFLIEPPLGNPLLELPNLVATPHIGAHSKEATTNASVLAARNVVQALETGEPIHRVV